MAASNSDRYVLLPGGLALPVEPILLAMELEDRGFSLTKEEPDTLSVQPYQRLTREDCTRIRRWKAHLLALVSYVPPEALQ
jgi:hypothetical protein